jgi:hypothetical protein
MVAKLAADVGTLAGFEWARMPDCTRALLAGELATLLKEYNTNG